MELLDQDFNPSQVEGTIIGDFSPAVNVSRLVSFNGKLICTNEKVYVMPNYNAGMVDAIGAGFYKPRCFTYAEIDSYNKTGLAGYRITLKDGTVLNFSNVFGKMRKGITAALDEGMGK
ncbi:MAG: hypothetical protein J6X89_01780 [Bacteroidales bacterium]|nr:hypothetical protein [Bacteroidales bacterium]